MKFHFALAVALATLAGAGCDKKAPPPAPPAATVDTGTNATNTTAAPATSQVQTQAAAVAKPGSGNPLTAPAEYVASVAGAQNLALKTVDIASVNSAIQQFNAAEGRFPKDLDELIAERYLVKVPATPAGTRLEYDEKQGTIRLVRK